MTTNKWDKPRMIILIGRGYELCTSNLELMEKMRNQLYSATACGPGTTTIFTLPDIGDKITDVDKMHQRVWVKDSWIFNYWHAIEYTQQMNTNRN